ncbi:hypothetical protein HZB05_01585 [Candidatus Wolfebacteria bacterium]|nr:hypothetical protein [Candidatus Wolfebacteria bacterium]
MDKKQEKSYPRPFGECPAGEYVGLGRPGEVGIGCTEKEAIKDYHLKMERLCDSYPNVPKCNGLCPQGKCCKRTWLLLGKFGCRKKSEELGSVGAKRCPNGTYYCSAEQNISCGCECKDC